MGPQVNGLLGERITRAGTPAIGFGEAEVVPPARPSASPWGMAVATSVVGAAAGWVIEEVAQRLRGRRR